MNIAITIIIGIVVLIDYLKVDTKNRKTTYIYFSFVFLSMLTSLSHKYSAFNTSPLDSVISKMEPVVSWIYGQFK